MTCGAIFFSGVVFGAGEPTGCGTSTGADWLLLFRFRFLLLLPTTRSLFKESGIECIERHKGCQTSSRIDKYFLYTYTFPRCLPVRSSTMPSLNKASKACLAVGNKRLTLSAINDANTSGNCFKYSNTAKHG